MSEDGNWKGHNLKDNDDYDDKLTSHKYANFLASQLLGQYKYDSGVYPVVEWKATRKTKEGNSLKVSSAGFPG